MQHVAVDNLAARAESKQRMRRSRGSGCETFKYAGYWFVLVVRQLCHRTSAGDTGRIDDTQADNKPLKRDIAASSAEIDKFVARVNLGQVQQQEIRFKKDALGQELKTAETALASAQNELQDLKTFRSRQNQTSKELDTEMKKLEESLAQLRSHNRASYIDSTNLGFYASIGECLGLEDAENE
jgi:hypothetical protein